MPNYCSNELTLKGKEDRLNWIESNNFDFNKICPVPQFDAFKEDDGTYWDYDWCYKMWGTKWTASDIEFDRKSPDELHITFVTAWNPPEGIYKSLMALGFDVNATYEEAGAGFFGRYYVKSIVIDNIPFHKELANPHYKFPHFDNTWDTEEKCIGLMKEIVGDLLDWPHLENIAKEFVDCHLEYLEHQKDDEDTQNTYYSSNEDEETQNTYYSSEE